MKLNVFPIASWLFCFYTLTCITFHELLSFHFPGTTLIYKTWKGHEEVTEVMQATDSPSQGLPARESSVTALAVAFVWGLPCSLPASWPSTTVELPPGLGAMAPAVEENSVPANTGAELEASTEGPAWVGLRMQAKQKKAFKTQSLRGYRQDDSAEPPSLATAKEWGIWGTQTVEMGRGGQATLDHS